MGQHLTGASVDVISTPEAWPGGTGTFFVRGTFAGNERVSLLVSKYAQDVNSDGDLVFTTPGQKNFTLGACDLKVRLEGAVAGTSIDAGFDP